MYIDVYIYIYICICMCIYIYISVYIYICTHSKSNSHCCPDKATRAESMGLINVYSINIIYIYNLSTTIEVLIVMHLRTIIIH